MLIKKIRLRNFKSIGDEPLELELKPLTILVGPGGSGKSSILHAIDWLVTFRRREISGMTFNLEDRKIYGVATFEELVHGHDPYNNEIEVAVTLEFPDVALRLVKELAKVVDWESLGYEDPPKEFRKLEYGFAFRYLEPRGQGYSAYKVWLKIDDKNIIGLEGRYDVKEGAVCKPIFIPRLEIFKPSYQPLILWSPTMFTNSLKDNNLAKFIDEVMETISARNFSGYVEGLLSEVYFLSGLRGMLDVEGGIEKGRSRVGKLGEDLIEVLARLLSSESPGVREGIGNDVIFWASVFGMGKLVSGLSEIGEGIRGRYVDVWNKLELRLSAASHGQKQLLAVIAQCFSSDKPNLIMVEEPEISLHPQFQAMVPLLFADVIGRYGKQVIMTTHSSFFMLGLARAIKGCRVRGETFKGPEEREIKLSPDDVAIYEVKRDEKTGWTKAERLRISPKYGVVEGGIPSFVEVEKELFKAIFGET